MATVVPEPPEGYWAGQDEGGLASLYLRRAPSESYAEYVIRASSQTKLYWDLLMVVLVVYNSISVPFLAAFDPENKLDALEAIEYTIDVCFAIDIVLSFLTSYLDHNGDEVVDGHRIAKHYGCGYKFPLDLISVIPLETILYEELHGKVKGKTLKLLSLIKLKRMVRLRRVIALLRFKKAFKLYIRILLVIFALFLFVHLAGSFWFMLVQNSEEWVAPKDLGKGVDLYGVSVWVQYTTSLYYATILFLGVDALPTNTAEVAYASVIVYLGAVLSAALFGQMTALVQSLNSKSAQYNEAMERVTQAMVNIKAPKSLHEKATEYIMSTYWRRDQQEELQKFFDTLSPSLRLEVCTQLYSNVLQHNFILGTSPECVELMVRNLSAKLCKPEDVLIYYEDVGTEMFILIQGEVSVRCPDKQGVESHIRFLYAGDFFGEVSLLTGARRTATVVTVNFCTLAVLQQDAFTEVMERFPFVRSKLLAHTVSKYEEEWKVAVLKVLSDLPFFQNCSKQELTQVYYDLKTERYEGNTVLANRNDTCDRLFILATGRVLVTAPRGRRPELDLLVLEAGAAGCICSCLTEQRQQFTLRSLTDVCLLFLSASSIKSTEYSEFAEQIPVVGAALDRFREKEDKNKGLFLDFAVPLYVLHRGSKMPRLKQAALKLMREARRKRLKAVSSKLDGLFQAIEKSMSNGKAENLEAARSDTDTLEFLIVKMMEDTVSLGAKVDRLVKETEEQVRRAEEVASKQWTTE